MRGTLVVMLLALACRAAPAVTLAEFRSLQDNRVAVRTSLGLRSARAVDARHLALTLGMSASEAAGNPESYRVVSFQDPAYAFDRFVRPLRAEAHPEPEAQAPEGCPFARFERTQVTLDLPAPLRQGVPYFIVAQGVDGTMVTGAHTAQGFTYRPGAPPPAVDPAVDLAVLGLRRLEPVGPSLLMLEFGPNFAPGAGSDPARYHVRLDSRAVAATRLGRITRIDTYLPVGWPFPAIPMHQVFLELSEPFRDGCRIEVSVDDAVTRAVATASLLFRERASLSGSIKANQVGYLPEAPKIAYLGRWMGSFPEGGAPPEGGPALFFPAEPRFTVCEARTGRSVFAGKARLVHRSGTRDEGASPVDHSGENVYLLDFTRFRTPGRYFLSVPQVGRSLSFAISPAAYEGAFRTQAYGLFAQRCGIELGPPHSVWRRVACHRKGIQPTTQSRLAPHELRELAGRVDSRYPLLPAYGGHHDAGDYNPRSHIDVAQTLMDAYEMAPRKFADGQLNIPEWGNGVPDILDEADWALRLWIGLQDADGGVFHGTESNGDPNFIQTAELDPLGDYAYAKDAVGSFTFAGAMAQASRLRKSLGKKGDAAGLLAQARRAYEWSVGHLEGSPAQPTADARAYAAAELLLTTGEARFREDFAAACVWAARPDADLDVYQEYDQSRAAWAYARCRPEVADSALRKATREAILRTVDRFISYNEKMAYAFLRHPWAPISWGTGAQLHWAIPATWAWHLTGDTRYRDWLVRSCDNTLGANPLGLSYIVGIGTRTVRAPLHNSRYSHLGEVVAGMQVNGPVERGEGYRVQEVAYPPLRRDFASLHTFVDCHFAIAMDEGLSRSQAEAMACFGLLLPDR